MSFIEKFFKDIEPKFDKGQQYGAYHEVFHALYSFFYNNHFHTKTSVHVRDSLDTKRYMGVVLIALMPALLFGIYNTGLQARMASGLSVDFISSVFSGATIVLPIIAVIYVVGLGIEFVSCAVRGHAVNEGFLITGMILPLTLPPTIPLWQVAIGTAFGVIVGKEVFGGTGKNFLNPALTARCFLFFAYPSNMSGEVWTYMLHGKDMLVDGFSGATALAQAFQTPMGEMATETLIGSGLTLDKLVFGFVPGSIGETSIIAIGLGALLLLLVGVGSWRTMSSAVVGAIVAILLFNTFSEQPMAQMPFYWHLAMGGFAFGIVFIATDPVTSPYMKTSQLIYGFLIGLMGMVIRVFNPAYPESWMLIILLMNVFAPFIDHWVMQLEKSKRIPNRV